MVYEVTNLIIHLMMISCIGYTACTKADSQYNTNMTLQRIAIIAGFIIWSGWAVLVGAIHNFKNLLWFLF